MSEAMHSFIVSVSCIVGMAVLIPSIEVATKRLRRNGQMPSHHPETIRLTPLDPKRRNF